MIRIKKTPGYTEIGGVPTIWTVAAFIITAAACAGVCLIISQKAGAGIHRLPLQAFAVTGFVLSFFAFAFKRKVRVNSESRKLEWFNAFGKKLKEFGFDDIDRIIFDTIHEKEVTKYGSTTRESQKWAVNVDIDGESFLVVESGNEQDARSAAEDIVRITGKEMINRTGETERVVDEKTVDMSILEKMKLYGKHPELENIEIDGKIIRHENNHEGWLVELNPERSMSTFRPFTWRFLGLTGALFLSAVVYAIVTWPGAVWKVPMFRYNIYAVGGALFIALVLAIRDLSYRESLIIDKEFVTIINRSFLGRTRTAIPVNEIEEIRIDMPIYPHITIDTDRRLYRTGYTLRGNRLDQLSNLIKALLWKIHYEE